MMLKVMQSSREETDKFTLANLKKADMMIYATQQRISKDDQLILWNVKEGEAKVVEAIEKIAKNPVQRFWRIGKDANPDKLKPRPLIIKTGKRVSNEKTTEISQRINLEIDLLANPPKKIYVNRDQVWIKRQVDKEKRAGKRRRGD
ncbi:hypothetical protein Ciccas_004971 [Cichlidogyrus casuarinus]|uniref:Uncharacterized protein n=1 Tax=Cichlidogyrus casuarinus TaxID=1844966 RepID=A0ABD2QA19_9PLAT